MREKIEMDVIGEIEIEAQVCIVFVEVEVFDNEGRMVVGCHQVFNGNTSFEVLSS
jgi:hypothetical protein